MPPTPKTLPANPLLLPYFGKPITPPLRRRSSAATAVSALEKPQERDDGRSAKVPQSF